MAFIIEPDGQNGGGAGGGEGGQSRRPDCRAGSKTLAVCGMTYGQSKAGNDKIDVCWIVIEDPDGGHDVGALVFDTFTLTQRAAWKLQQVSGALGQKASWDVEDQDATWKVLSQSPVKAAVKMEPKWNGDGEKPAIERYSRSSTKISKELDKLIEDAERWYVAWQKKKQGGGSDSGRSSRSAPFGDSDIPF